MASQVLELAGTAQRDTNRKLAFAADGRELLQVAGDGDFQLTGIQPQQTSETTIQKARRADLDTYGTFCIYVDWLTSLATYKWSQSEVMHVFEASKFSIDCNTVYEVIVVE
jgi:hypothetical protein